MLLCVLSIVGMLVMVILYMKTKNYQKEYVKQLSSKEHPLRMLYPMCLFLLSGTRLYSILQEKKEEKEMLKQLLILYVTYELEIAGHVSAAAENLTRQNVTTESLKRIDELEEEKARVERKERKAEEFSKVLDNFTKLRNY